MKVSSAVAAAVLAVTPALASASAFSIGFEKDWSGENGDIVDYYNGGRAADPDDASIGPNLGVSFVNVSGLSNSAATPGFPFYSNAPSPRGTAYAHDLAYLNVAGGVSNALSFFYANPAAALGAIRAYSGLNGTGSLLGSIDLAANDLAVGVDGIPVYDTFSLGRLQFAGVARSFDFSGSATTGVLFDNLATVPEPGIVLTMLAGAAALVGARRRRVR